MVRSRVGRRINGALPHNLARAGLVLVPERDKVFATLSVQENLAFAAREAGSLTLDPVLSYFPGLPSDVRRLPDTSAAVKSKCWRSG